MIFPHAAVGTPRAIRTWRLEPAMGTVRGVFCAPDKMS